MPVAGSLGSSRNEGPNAYREIDAHPKQEQVVQVNQADLNFEKTPNLRGVCHRRPSCAILPLPSLAQRCDRWQLEPGWGCIVCVCFFFFLFVRGGWGWAGGTGFLVSLYNSRTDPCFLVKNTRYERVVEANGPGCFDIKGCMFRLQSSGGVIPQGSWRPLFRFFRLR